MKGFQPTLVQECSSLTSLVFHVNQDDIAVHAFFQRPFPNHVETVRHVGRHPFHDILNAASTVFGMGEHDRQRGLHAGHAV